MTQVSQKNGRRTALPPSEAWAHGRVGAREPPGRRTAPSALDTAPAAVVSFVRRRSAPALQVPTEVQRFFKKEHRTIVPLTVKDILDEEIAMKLA